MTTPKWFIAEVTAQLPRKSLTLDQFLRIMQYGINPSIKSW